MIQTWPGSALYSSDLYSQKHSFSSDVISSTIILYWHIWGCLGVHPQLMGQLD